MINKKNWCFTYEKYVVFCWNRKRKISRSIYLYLERGDQTEREEWTRHRCWWSSHQRGGSERWRREEGESQEGDTKHNNKNQSTVSHSSLTTVSVSQSVDWPTALSSVKLLWNKSVVKLKPPQTHTELRRVCCVCVMTVSYSGGAVGYRCVYIYIYCIYFCLSVSPSPPM